MKMIRRVLLIGMLAFIFPSSVYAYQTDIVENEVTLQNIVRHFNGESRLERDKDGAHYAEYIFDGVNITIRADEGFVWINGEAKPYKIITSEGVTLPKHHTLNNIWDKTNVPVDLFTRELGYRVKGEKLVFDKPLGASEVDDYTENNKVTNEQDSESEPDNLDESEINEVSETDSLSNKENDTEGNPVPQTDIGNSHNVTDKQVEDTAEEEVPDSKVEKEEQNNEGEPRDEPEQDDEIKDNETSTDNNQDTEERDDRNTLSLLGIKFPIGRHFNLKASYPEKQKYIKDGNILTTWNNLRVDSNRSTLIVGQGDTTFKNIQGKLTIGTLLRVTDASNKVKEYSVAEKKRTEIINTDSLHDELYMKYKDTNSIVLQFQEDNKMSFYVAK